MSTVSTAPSILRAMQMDDEALVSLIGRDAAPAEHEQRSLWNIPGLGVIGAGSAALAAVMAWKAVPSFKEEVDSLKDFLGLGNDEVADKLEKIGLAGAKFDEKAEVPSGRPRISQEPEVKNLPAQVSSPEAQVAVPPLPAAGAPAPALVNKGSQVSPVVPPVPYTGRLAAPSVQVNAILTAAAQSEGIEHGMLYAVAGAESSFRTTAKAGTSSAVGLFQFTLPTWNYLTRKAYPELGYTAKDRSDPQKSAVVAARYLKSIRASLSKKLGRAPSIGETYLGYFIGPTGAARFLDALSKNPSALGASVFPDAARANPNLFYDSGNKQQPLTLQQTMDRLSGKVSSYYTAAANAQRSTVAEAAPSVPQSSVIPVNGFIPAVSASPQPVPVDAPDFTATPGGAKGDARSTPMTPGVQGSTPGKGGVVALPQKAQPGQKTYTRDRHGRLFAIPS